MTVFIETEFPRNKRCIAYETRSNCRKHLESVKQSFSVKMPPYLFDLDIEDTTTFTKTQQQFHTCNEEPANTLLSDVDVHIKTHIAPCFATILKRNYLILSRL
jgi:hypothetical protein